MTQSEDVRAKIGWPAIGIILGLIFPAGNTVSLAEEVKDSEKSICCCLRPLCDNVDPSKELRHDTNEEVNSSIEEHPPCGAPGSDGNPLIAVTPGIRSCVGKRP
jgi:hypothetical protein